jgi:hypothetical protein
LRSFPASEISLPFLFSQFLFCLSFPSSILIYFFRFSFSLLLSLSSSILSCFFRTTGSRVSGLEDTHLHPYPHITSLTDRCVILYLADFAIAGSWVSRVELSYTMFPDIHFASKISTIYILTPELPKIPSLIPPTMSSSDHRAILYLANFEPSTVAGSRVPKFPCSKKVSNPICLFLSRLSPPPSCSSQCAFSML